jgi:hypothetical protein
MCLIPAGRYNNTLGCFHISHTYTIDLVTIVISDLTILDTYISFKHHAYTNTIFMLVFARAIIQSHNIHHQQATFSRQESFTYYC